MPSLNNAMEGTKDKCRCGETITLVAPASKRGMSGWRWQHDRTSSVLCHPQEAEPTNFEFDENADGHLLISDWKPIKRKVAFYSLRGSGPIEQISKDDYIHVLWKAVKSEYHEETMRPFNGVNYLGTAYLVIPIEDEHEKHPDRS